VERRRCSLRQELLGVKTVEALKEGISNLSLIRQAGDMSPIPDECDLFLITLDHVRIVLKLRAMFVAFNSFLRSGNLIESDSATMSLQSCTGTLR
jgi:hypothetical protein